MKWPFKRRKRGPGPSPLPWLSLLVVLDEDGPALEISGLGFDGDTVERVRGRVDAATAAKLLGLVRSLRRQLDEQGCWPVPVPETLARAPVS
ncbi:MAG TPA: hypothetical protein VGS12_09790 [Caulobacteraceae bacterium]|nr:hypothetical protein [Caulobacteraceae bacterium]